VGRHRLAWQIATIGGVWAYALISGAAAPATRAAIVATAAILAFRVGRRPDFPTLIVLAAGAMALVDPGQVDTLGFRLSVAASLALALVLPPLMTRARGAGLAAVLAATVAAQIATLPLLLPVFGTVSLASVPANIVAAPLVAVAMPLAALAGLAGLVWWPLGEMIAAPATVAVGALIAVVDLLGAPDAFVSFGVPPMGAAVIVAVTGAALILVLMGDSTHIGDLALPREMRLTGRQMMRKGMVLPPAPPLIFAREDPLHALGADPDDAEKQPAGEKDRHEVADVR
jgi:competence protein ComEC